MSVVSLSSKKPLEKQIENLETHFATLFSQCQIAPDVTYDERKNDLEKLHQAIKKNIPTLCHALSEDFGHRSHEDSLLVDIIPCLSHLKYTKRHFKKWMRPEKRHPGLHYFPAKVRVYHQALGVIGIVVPWNAPLTLSLIPLATALAAGNRVMLKLSELSPHTNQCLTTLINSVFDQKKVCVIEGDASVASAFCQLPFDHLLFTGSNRVAKQVMQAAAENLTPLTLELGGKSPVILDKNMPAPFVAKRILFGKELNAGQICVAPDHLFVPEPQLKDMVEALRHEWQKHYPSGIAHKDRTAIISAPHYDRLVALLEDAKVKGATVIPLSHPAVLPHQRKMALHLVINPPSNCLLMQQEIFGPILPIITYQDPHHLISVMRTQPKPLALYLMSHDPKFKEYVISHTQAGTMAINDTVTQVGITDAPFGGIGASGFGQYHGIEGFRRFTHAKTCLERGRFNPSIWLRAPYHLWWKKICLYFMQK